ncbi:KH domain-containing protein HEN4-like isoform X1 [Senna tora]|uniref:KH domain-containing protein HEN4-like isoform X1 n=1 Tax=Senna tora TaxID=362788 RepID=A0A834SHR0_9FABA|nr:KH domain-containing protein HEN4-like isoform X1 [Senna tora]
MGSIFLSPPVKRRAIYTETGMADPNPVPSNGSSKRSKSKHPPPPLSIPPGHVAFRLLCHASRIGGVIGKSGTVIKNLQQVTGAKIRVEDAPPESPDRVIVVIAPAALSGKVSSRSKIQNTKPAEQNGGDGEEGIEVSKAQEALVKVFERILDVAAETDGIEVGDGVVSCRLLADTAQVGSVIGKGGKVVEKIRKDTGCKIRVLTDKLPACTSSSDEVVEKDLERRLGFGVLVKYLKNEEQVYEPEESKLQVLLSGTKEARKGARISNNKITSSIEGNVPSVKKALVAVSRRLQDFPPPARTKIMGSKSYEVVQHESIVAVPHETLTAVPRETLPDLHVDHLLQRSSSLSTLPSSYASGVHSVSAEVNRVSTLDPTTFHQEVSFRILCSIDRVGGVIGKSGSIVRALQNETGATISVGPSVADCEDRLITVTASENLESRYSPAQKAVVLVFSRSIEAGIEKGLDSGLNQGSSVTARLLVQSNQVGCLLGKGGSIVSEMRKATGANIKIIGADQVPKCASHNDQVVQVGRKIAWDWRRKRRSPRRRLFEPSASHTLRGVAEACDFVVDACSICSPLKCFLIMQLLFQISGEFSNVQDALYNATGRLRDNLFASTQNSAGTKTISSVLADTSPHGRLRDPIPFGTQPTIGISHSLSRHTMSQNIDQVVSRYLDHPSSPGSWAPRTVSGINSRGINDIGRGLTSLKGGLELGSGSKTAMVTNTTVEIVVPDEVIGSVYGENGGNLARLRQISGAKVIVHEPRHGTRDRTIVISGTPDETQAAQSLLQAFILTGSS